MKLLFKSLSLLFIFSLFSLPLYPQSKADCLMCHSDSTLTMERKGKTVSIYVDDNVLSHSAHKKLVCVACHTGFNPDDMPHKEHITPVQCLTCHQDAPTKHSFHKTILAKGGSDVSKMCKECHGTHDVQSPKVAGTKFSPSHIVESCGTCHAEEKDHYLQSAHGEAYTAHNKNAPTCVSCHSQNITTVTAGTDSVQLKIAQEQVCVSCHGTNKVSTETGPTKSFVMSYEASVHGQALKNGNGKAANCVDCHGNHDMRKGTDPKSFVNRVNIPNTCAKCHPTIAAEYKASIHGTAFLAGNKDAPVCTDCHGEHNILNPVNPKAPTSHANVSQEVCSKCHTSVALSAKYGLNPNRLSTFRDSYHGLALEGGATTVANCASCHTAHNVYPSSDPRSSVNKANLAKTCGKCHPGANAKFAEGPVHVVVSEKQNPLLYYVTSTYIVLIIVTIGGMFFHNLFDFLKKAKHKLRTRRGHFQEEEVGHSLYVRMTLSERLQHASLFVSFITLVITGFMLKFPDAWWVEPIRSINPAVFEIRSLLHRIAAVILIGAGLYHLYYISFTQRGRKLIYDLLPRIQDIHDALAVAKYNLGMSRVKPRFDRFSYIEKSEYWALVWGTVIMGLTGSIMWFDNTSLGLIGKLWFDVARTVHYYEAWLATLAIIVWHFYFVIFNPDIYPMNLAWFKGTITEEEMLEEHPIELEKLKQQQLEEAKNPTVK
jgi:cytochrome b subunit of formate dehydrogenase